MIKLKVKSKGGVRVLRPSRLHYKVVRGDSGLGWQETRESGKGGRVYPQEAEIGPGCHEVERVANPFIEGGEPWLVLKGSRIGAAESYLRQLAEATRGPRTERR